MSRVKDIPDIRFITGFNTLSENELPDVFVDMLSKEAAEIKKSRLCAFDTRADSVKPERLRKWKNLFGENTGVNIGVESSNEWLRNHWIGKKIRNGSLKNAVDIIKSEDMLSSMSILLGIPGLSELQSIAVFLDSLDFVISLNPDRIVLSPTMCQKYTLQNYIKDNFRTEEHVFRGLNDINSSRWVISIYSVYVSCRIAVKLYPHFSDKIMLNPEFFYSYFFEDHYLEYAEEDEKDIMRKIMKLLNECIRCGNFNSLYDENSEIINNPVFVRYFQNLNMQDSPSEIKKTILFTGQTLINKMDFSAKTNLYIKLKNEIKNFSYIPKYSWDDIDRLLNK